MSRRDHATGRAKPMDPTLIAQEQDKRLQKKGQIYQ